MLLLCVEHDGASDYTMFKKTVIIPSNSKLICKIENDMKSQNTMYSTDKTTRFTYQQTFQNPLINYWLLPRYVGIIEVK